MKYNLTLEGRAKRAYKKYWGFIPNDWNHDDGFIYAFIAGYREKEKEIE